MSVKKIKIAIQNFDVSYLKNIINKYKNINKIIDDGRALVHFAVEEDSVETIEFLKEQGCKFNDISNTRYTPLEYACICNSLDSAKFLLSNGCTITDYELIYAASCGSKEIVEVLIGHGINTNALDYSNRNASHWATQEGHVDIMKILTENDCDINAIDDDGSTPLYIAASENKINIVNFLVRRGAILDLTQDASPFQIACAYECYEVADILLLNGADVNYVDEDGRTALFYAKVRDDEKLTSYLINNGARDDIIDNYGISINHLNNDDLRNQLMNELF